nr:serpin-ZX [Tanacetum cinerariifolium]
MMLYFMENLTFARVWFDKLWIPKFMISCTFEAKDVMKQMGLTLPFEETNDELSRIVDLRTLFGNTLYVSKILQKSFIEVDEKGTKDDAISFMECEVGANMSDSNSKPLPPPTFILSNRKTGLQFSLANGVWVDRRAEPIQCSYQKVLETVYRTEARYVDFRDKVKCGEAVNKINSWVHKETKGLITSIVQMYELSQDSIMVIANALYFKEEWENPFYAHETKYKDFSLITGVKVSVPFMTSNKEFEYGSFKGYKMIKIPYESNKLGKSKKFSMYIFLPHKKVGLKKLLQKFHSNDALFQGKFDLARVWFDKLWIPMFTISCTFKAKDVMKQIGLTLPFEETNEELGEIVE